MSDDLLLTDLSAGVYTLTLNHPKANAFNDGLIGATKAAFKEAKKNTDIRCVLLNANGKLFSAGQDISNFDDGERLSFRQHLLTTYNPLIIQMRSLEKPVLASIQGAVAGAALGIVLACDMRIASEQALFVVGFGGIGLVPDSAVSLLLPKIIGLGRATEAIYLNQPINAKQAFDWGLVNKLVGAEELAEATQTMAANLAKGPTLAIGLSKRTLNKAILPNLASTLDYEAHVQEVAGNGPDHKEGLAAFLEKREPIFTNPAK